MKEGERGAVLTLCPHLPTQGQGESGHRDSGTAAWCPLVGLEDALSEAPGMGGRPGGAFCRACSPSPELPLRVPRGRLGCSEQPGRECRDSVWRPGPPGVCVPGLVNLVPDQLSTTSQDVLLPLPLPPPTAASELVPTLCRPTLSPTGIPSLWLSLDGGGGKETGR